MSGTANDEEEAEEENDTGDDLEATGDAEDSGWFTCVAEADVENMGWASVNEPPDRVFITEVAEGSWAEDQGIQAGDELYSVSVPEAVWTSHADEPYSVNVTELDDETFVEYLQEKPIALVFYRADFDAGDDPEDGHLQMTATGGSDNEDPRYSIHMGDQEEGSPQATDRSEDAGDADRPPTNRSNRTENSGGSTRSKRNAGEDAATSARSGGSTRASQRGAQEAEEKTSSRRVSSGRGGSKGAASSVGGQDSAMNSSSGIHEESPAVNPLAPKRSSTDAASVLAPIAEDQRTASKASSAAKLQRSQTIPHDGSPKGRWKWAIAKVTNKQKTEGVFVQNLVHGRIQKHRSNNPLARKTKTLTAITSVAASSRSQKSTPTGAAVLPPTMGQTESSASASGRQLRSRDAELGMGQTKSNASGRQVRMRDLEPGMSTTPPKGPPRATPQQSSQPSAGSESAPPVEIPASWRAARDRVKLVAAAVVAADRQQAARTDMEFDTHNQALWARRDRGATSSDSESDPEVAAWRRRVAAEAKQKRAKAAKAKARPRSAEELERFRAQERKLEQGWTPSGRAMSTMFESIADLELLKTIRQPMSPLPDGGFDGEKVWAERHLSDRHERKKINADVEERLDFWFADEFDTVDGTTSKPGHVDRIKARRKKIEQKFAIRRQQQHKIEDAKSHLSAQEKRALDDQINFYLGVNKTKISEETRQQRLIDRENQKKKEKLQRKARALLRGKDLYKPRNTVTLTLGRGKKYNLEMLETAEQQQQLYDRLLAEHHGSRRRQQEVEEALTGGISGMDARTKDEVLAVDDDDGHLRDAFMKKVEEEFVVKEGTVLDELLRNLKSWDGSQVIRLSKFQLAEVSSRIMDKYRQIIPVPLKEAFKSSLALVCMVFYTKTDVDIDRLLGFHDVPTLPRGMEVPSFRDAFYRDYRAVAKEQGRNPQMFQDANWGTRIAWEGSAAPESAAAARIEEAWAYFRTWVKWICLLGVMSEAFVPPRSVTRGLTGLPDFILENFKSKKPGDTIFWAALSSTTEDATISWNYCNQQEPVERNAVFSITNVTEGLEISAVSQYPNEKELLLPPFSLLEVTGVSWGEGRPVEMDCEFKGCTLSESLRNRCEQEFLMARQALSAAEEKWREDERDRKDMEKTLRNAKGRVNFKANGAGGGEAGSDGSGSDVRTDDSPKAESRYKVDTLRNRFLFKGKGKGKGKNGDNTMQADQSMRQSDVTEASFKDMHLGPADGAPLTYKQRQELRAMQHEEKWRQKRSVSPSRRRRHLAWRPASNVNIIPMGMSYHGICDAPGAGPKSLYRVQSVPAVGGCGSSSNPRTSTSTSQRRSTVTTTRGSNPMLHMNRRAGATLRFAPAVSVVSG